MYYINMRSLVYCSRTLVQPFPLEEQNRQNIYESTKLWSADLASADRGCLISTSCFVLGKQTCHVIALKYLSGILMQGEKNRVQPLDKLSGPQFLSSLLHSSS